MCYLSILVLLWKINYDQETKLYYTCSWIYTYIYITIYHVLIICNIHTLCGMRTDNHAHIPTLSEFQN